MRNKIAADWYKSKFTERYIARKHNVSINLVREIIIQTDLKSKEKKDFIVIKVEKKSAAYAEEVLKRYGIKTEIPNKFELTEYIESKL